MDMDDINGDPRHEELETLKAIYPEIRLPDEKDPFTFEIELPVEPVAPITVTFPAASTNTLPGLNATPQAAENAQPEVVDSLQVSHLPPLCLRIRLPEGYPAHVAPHIDISTTPQWLAAETIQRLRDDGPRLWDEIGRDMVAFTYLDHVQRAAEDVFGTTTPEGTLEVDSEHKLAVLDYDIKAKKAAFEKETFDCGICLDPKKGSGCHKMLDCGHIFCLQCLRDFYNDAINEGNISTVRCLTPNCAKDRAAALSKANGKTQPARKPNVSINPSELLQIGLSEDTVKRYVTLKYKTELESDKNTIYCPRQWCSGAARSKRHRKPEGLDFVEASDHDSDVDEKAEVKPNHGKKKFDNGDLLAVCEDCGFAFCSRCEQSWHGEFVRCYPKRDRGEVSAEEKASLEYLQLHTSPCPTCNAPAQKTHGCNHMICSRCDTHFCYLCSAWLDPTNPYRHYNQQPGGKVTSCYMRLWELEGGDGDDVGLAFIGGRGRNVDAPHPEVEIPLEVALGDDEANVQPANNVDERPLDDQGNPIHVAREAPLVLRLMDNRPRGGRNGPRPVPPAAAPEAPPHAAADRRAAPGRGGRDGARAGRAGGGRGARQRGGRGGAANRPNQQQDAAQQQDQGRRDGLDEAQAAWVRNFVQMALNDQEDLLEGDSDDDDDDNWFVQ